MVNCRRTRTLVGCEGSKHDISRTSKTSSLDSNSRERNEKDCKEWVPRDCKAGDRAPQFAALVDKDHSRYCQWAP
jgi:hypothetical protein